MKAYGTESDVPLQTISISVIEIHMQAHLSFQII